MEKYEQDISLQNLDVYIKEKTAFGWQVVDIKKGQDLAHVTFERDPEMPHYEKLKELENKWFSFSYPPIWPMIVLCVIAFGLITALLVIWIVQKDQFNGLLWFLSLGLPAFGCITLSTVWFGIRISKMKKTLDKVDETRKEIVDELAKLEKECDEHEDVSQDI